MINLSTHLNEVTFAIFDIETTGLSPQLGDRICEIGILRVKNGKEKEAFHSLINPQRPISKEASAINGITDEMVKTAPTFKEIINKIPPLFKNACIVCHNAPFDLGFISFQLKEFIVEPINNPVVDTLILSRKYLNCYSNSLNNLAKVLGLPPQEHRAMQDVKITKSLFEYLIELLKEKAKIETLEDLLKIQR